MSPATLVVLPSVPMVQDGDQVFLDIKAVEGLALYAKLWPGPVRCLFRSGERFQIGYGQSYHPADLPFEVHPIPDHVGGHTGLFDDAAVILAAADNYFDLELPDVTRAPVAFVIEYTLGTRLRIVRLDRGLSFNGLKSAVWTLKTEVRRRKAMRRAAGLQANGTPAYDAYHVINPEPLLYFDNRIRETQQPTADELAHKKARIMGGVPLRLAFSGRLEPMKGADHLVPVMAALTRHKVDFSFDIFGDGSLAAGIQAAVLSAGIVANVRFHGPVPFDDVLVPALKRDIDLFVCCHRQADPSCTYVETLACGVPIVGYDNAAFTGVLRLGEAGVAVRMNDFNAVAHAIEQLDHDRGRLADMVDAAAAVGRQHSFEKTFAARVAHLQLIARM